MTTGNDGAYGGFEGADGRGAAPTRERTRQGSRSGRGTIWTTGVFAVAWAAANLYYVLTGEPPADTAYLPAVLAGLISWIMLSDWTCTVADARRREGVSMPSNGWIWFAWFIPIAHLFSPAKTLWKLGTGRMRMSLLLAWWLPWLVMDRPAFGPPAARDESWLIVETVAILFSWLALQAIIRRISDDSVT